MGSFFDHCLRRALDRLRRRDDQGRSCLGSWNAAHARDRCRHPGRRQGLSRPPIHHDRHRRRGHLFRARVSARNAAGDRLRPRRHSVRRCRLYRHEHLGPRQCQNRPGRHQEPRRRLESRLPLRCNHRHAGRRPRPSRRRGLLPHPDDDRRLCGQRSRGRRLAGRPRLRRLADLDLRPSRRRHLHQGRRRRRRSRWQGRSRHSRGRSAQPGDHRRQCRRQCRRLRRHGRRPVRDLRGDHGRHHGARRDLLRRPAGARSRHALSAGDLRRLHPDLDRGHLLRQARAFPVDHGRPLQGPDRHRPALDRRPRHRDAADGWVGRYRHRQWRRRQRLPPVHLRHHRPRHHRPDRLDHRVLHRHGQAPGRLDRPGLRHRPRHERDPGSCDLARVRPRCRRWSSSPASSRPISLPASSARPSR